MNAFSHSTSLEHSPTNDTRLEEFEGKVREFGRLAAQGKDSLPMLAQHIVRAAADGLLDFDTSKHESSAGAGDCDDAKYYYGEYLKANSKKAVHEHDPDGKKANISKLRALIKFGVLPHTTCDAVDVFNRAFTVRGNMASVDPKSVKPAYSFYVDVARAQLEAEEALSDEALGGIARKPDPKEKTIESVLTSVQKTLEKLITGEGGLKCQDEAVINAHDQIKGFVGTLMLTNERAQKQAALDKLQAEIAAMNQPSYTTPESLMEADRLMSEIAA